jgi:uncharacterized membrane protein YcaP (DUF421 family)
MASLRAAGCAAATEVHFAILENNGHISVQPRKNGPNSHNGSVAQKPPPENPPEIPPESLSENPPTT